MRRWVYQAPGPLRNPGIHERGNDQLGVRRERGCTIIFMLYIIIIHFFRFVGPRDSKDNQLYLHREIVWKKHKPQACDLVFISIYIPFL